MQSLDIMLIFVAFLGAALLLMMGVAGKSAPAASVAERVRKVSAGGVVREDALSKQSFFERVLVPMSENVGRAFGGMTPAKLVQDSNKVLGEAGLSRSLTGAQMAGFSWILALGLPTLLLALYGGASMPPIQRVAMLGIGAYLGFRLPFILLAGRAKKRKAEIVKSLPFAFDLLGISVEAGMGFDGAMAAVAERSRGPLAEELNRTLTEVRLGKPRTQALTDLGERTNCEDLKSFTAAVAFISQLGGSLTDVLRIQADAMRVKRRQRAEEKAMKAPVKIMIPLVFFIFPCMFVVILGPAVIMIMESMVGGG